MFFVYFLLHMSSNISYNGVPFVYIVVSHSVSSIEE